MLTPYHNGDDPYASGQHRGIDIAGEVGDPVRSATDGKVEYAGSLGSSGRTFSIRTADDRFETSYLHLSETDVKKGDEVDAGDRIGAVGTTGTRTVERPHLHFGVRVADTKHDYRDPLELLAARPAEGPAASPEVPVPEEGVIEPAPVESTPAPGEPIPSDGAAEGGESAPGEDAETGEKATSDEGAESPVAEEPVEGSDGSEAPGATEGAGATEGTSTSERDSSSRDEEVSGGRAPVQGVGPAPPRAESERSSPSPVERPVRSLPRSPTAGSLAQPEAAGRLASHRSPAVPVESRAAQRSPGTTEVPSGRPGTAGLKVGDSPASWTHGSRGGTPEGAPRARGGDGLAAALGRCVGPAHAGRERSRCTLGAEPGERPRSGLERGLRRGAGSGRGALRSPDAAQAGGLRRDTRPRGGDGARRVERRARRDGRSVGGGAAPAGPGRRGARAATGANDDRG